MEFFFLFREALLECFSVRCPLRGLNYSPVLADLRLPSEFIFQNFLASPLLCNSRTDIPTYVLMLEFPFLCLMVLQFCGMWGPWFNRFSCQYIFKLGGIIVREYVYVSFDYGLW